jgi:magnesium chelatase subunit ChlD-like protein
MSAGRGNRSPANPLSAADLVDVPPAPHHTEERRLPGQAGRRRRAITTRPRGRTSRAVPARGLVPDIALGSTIRAAARRGAPLQLRREDVHRRVRVAPRGTTILFVVDTSWSMAVARRLSAARGAVQALLADAYLRRDRIGLITFRNSEAELRVAPTGAISAARRALANTPVGGRTPLAAALVEAMRVFRRERIRHPESDGLMVMLTDGGANVSLHGGPPLEEAWRAAARLRRARVRAIVINAAGASGSGRLATLLARQLGAPCLAVTDYRADLLYRAVRRALDRV